MERNRLNVWTPRDFQKPLPAEIGVPFSGNYAILKGSATVSVAPVGVSPTGKRFAWTRNGDRDGRAPYPAEPIRFKAEYLHMSFQTGDSVLKTLSRFVQPFDHLIRLPQGFRRVLRGFTQLHQGFRNLFRRRGLRLHALIHDAKPRS